VMSSGGIGHDGGRVRDQHVVLASADSWGFVSLRQPATPRRKRYAIGRSLRKQVPRATLGTWSPTAAPTPYNRSLPPTKVG
jgi:hypothetical protein